MLVYTYYIKHLKHILEVIRYPPGRIQNSARISPRIFTNHPYHPNHPYRADDYIPRDYFVNKDDTP